jgi:glucoamylase
MPRDLPLGNGSLLVNFDNLYQIRDLYWPHVGQENHALGHPFRMGVWVNGNFRWFDDPGWKRDLRYQPDTLVTQISLEHPDLNIRIRASDAVDFHENLLLREFEITNLTEQQQEVRLFFHQDFHIAEHVIGDTAYYEPDRRAIIHYKGKRWFLINGAILHSKGDPGPGWPATEDTAEGFVVGVHQWACGLKEIHNLEGTWRDAQDGQLSLGTVAHGSVDSTVGLVQTIPPNQSRRLYYWIAIAENFEGVTRINRLVRQRGPQRFIQRTANYWQLWLQSHAPEFGSIPEKVRQQYLRSLLVLRTQIDNGGAIIAANDSDISSAVRDTYSYLWPRDGALVAEALVRAGYINLPRAFFEFCADVLTKEGYLLHKYNPDRTLASSWHPWVRDGLKDLPIQEDETALVIWALWKHFKKFSDVEFIKPLYRKLIVPAAEFMTHFRDEQSGLPLPSYDLWEERHGVHAWSVAATWAGLEAAANFAEAFGESEAASQYRQVAAEIKSGVEAHLWQADLKRYARSLTPTGNGGYVADNTIDASNAGLWMFGMYAPDDPKIVAMMGAIRERLWVKTEVGGLARYENDYYHQVSQDIPNVAGNPWFITTLWLAEWYAETANSAEELKNAMDLLLWVAERSLPSGVLAEQVNPYTNQPLSVSPLTWSHATYVAVVQRFLDIVGEDAK